MKDDYLANRGREDCTSLPDGPSEAPNGASDADCDGTETLYTLEGKPVNYFFGGAKNKGIIPLTAS
jgi:hypothetical protein